MLFISEDQVKNIIDMDLALQAIQQAFLNFSYKLVEVSPRVTMTVRGDKNSCIFLPANYLSMPFFGIKYASSFPDNKEKGKDTVISQITLYSAETGEPIAIISANYLTAIKTGAAAGVATDILAKKNACRLAVIGTGIQAETQVMAIQKVRSLKEVCIFDKDPHRAEQFMSYIEKIKNQNYDVKIAGSADQCIQGADIISTCTSSSTPVICGNNLNPGTHINAIGAYTPSMQEIDPSIILKANKIVTDHTEEAWAAAGDLIIPLNEGIISKSKLYGELGDIIAGKIPGRESEEEITLYESVGFSVLDIAAAILVYKQYSKLQAGF